MTKTMDEHNSEKQGFIGGVLVGIGTKIVAAKVEKALGKAMTKVSADPSIPIDSKEDQKAVQTITQKEVMKEVGPLIENLQNQEPLWRSKVLWTAIGTVATSAAGIYAMLTGDNRAVELVLMAGTALTGVGTIISRIFPSKAIGR